ncbi:DUF2164 domain-containing protein [Psychrosphaera ytuae]|uniref:DUF2164 domain-containing protein n=1 Tax=Psychrosphaera ytuae TaxID=2820710 RepID=A0A975HIC9_9GAMM|nr:DUF2164 domain-containing protein [Psychrosphaera ytuae]QTH64018.1 DUF2164 domain-containing protein [Psychrosphaera ytuae]
MAKIEFTQQQKDTIVERLQDYMGSELDVELGQFDAEFLLDFITKELGGHFYNKGIEDARTVFEKRVQSIDEDLYAIEQDVT